MKNTLQKFGKTLSAMVMPNIGAFIAWGFITALFIANGWIPNEKLAQMVNPMLNYLLPVLVAYQGGKIFGQDRGGVMGAIAVIGVIAGAPEYPMLMGAMLIGPLGGIVIKKFDKFMENRMPAGFEMLINNFSVGILGMLLSILGYYLIGPLMSTILVVLTCGVDILIQHGLLPLAAIFIEPAKVLFLNNAINHGIFTPIATMQVQEAGKSIMYMLEANPGPGLGILLAYFFFSKSKVTKDSAPGAIIIHFLGGIHEIYFPYVLMNPVLIVAPIIGNICAIFFYSITGTGLVGPASPGSIIAFLSMSTKGSGGLFTLAGVIIAAAVSFLIASPIVKMSHDKSLEEALAKKETMKQESKGIVTNTETSLQTIADARLIVFACDAGMGSSAMGATKFRNRLKTARPDIKVINTSVDNIPSDCDIAVVQTILVDRAKKSCPRAQIIEIGNFLADANLDSLYFQLTTGDAMVVSGTAEENKNSPKYEGILTLEGIRINQHANTKEDAIFLAGKALYELGYVEEEYIKLMIERERLVSTYMGMGLAIPHGTTHEEGIIKKTGIVVLQFPDGVPFGDEKAQLVVGIAGKGGEHMEVLAKVATALDNEEVLNKMKTTSDVEWILEQLS
ncbi:MAG: PTS mannitol transporter subunit IICBA [Erysipelotrichaceae bacterium]|nr:PTS mannitol transporter subunit IICBA [Erysipelotrichaceae bacterium]